ncbi:Pro-Pol polyprotein [Portunus trituberculatus]|uniref:Pro-Pol polyprotein n=1 Tax=Portunus trituberculatus TaxID=210409 RepID=A0A5B7I0T5_PORTR|nr:Pro-Pol polyprotein [Portunus trituberculatus]
MWIENALEPQGNCVEGTGTRPERLQKLIGQEDWTHFSNDHQKQLSDVVLSHEEYFMLNNKEIGTISGEPAHIAVSDPNPCKSPIYPYPEHAKMIVSQMLVDMEERGVIEPSNTAWLSPIVLVNKPDGSKRMCLDFRRVNEHLSANISVTLS